VPNDSMIFYYDYDQKLYVYCGKFPFGRDTSYHIPDIHDMNERNRLVKIKTRNYFENIVKLIQ